MVGVAISSRGAGLVGALSMDVSIEATAILAIVEISMHASVALILALSNASSQSVSVLVTVLFTHLGAPFDTKGGIVLIWLIMEILSAIPTRALSMSLT